MAHEHLSGILQPLPEKIKLPQTQEHNQLNDQLYNNLPVAIYTCDRLGYITSFNKAAEKLWGRSPEIGKDLWCGSWKIFNPDGEPLLLDDCPMARTLKEGVAIEGEEIIIERPDGTRLNVQPCPVPLFDEQGRLSGAVNTLIDVTEQRIGEAKQAMLAAIIESSEDAIVSKTLNGIITSWNDAAKQMFGYEDREIVGKSVTLLIPGDRQQEEQVILGKIRSGKRVEHYETIRVTKNGAEIPVSLTISPIKNTKGRIIGASKIVRNIVRQKTAEESLQRYADNLEALNDVGKAISGSLDVQEILQRVIDTTTQITGASCGAFFYNQLNENEESIMLYVLSGQQKETLKQFVIPNNVTEFPSAFNVEHIIRVDDVTKYPEYHTNTPFHSMAAGYLPVASYMAIPVISKSGKIVGGLFYGHPKPAKFTKAHESLVAGIANHAGITLDNAKLYEQVQKLNAKKDEFIGLASHELKTPITSLSGYLQIINKRLPDNDQNKSFIEKALLQIGKLSGLLSDLLDVSKIETGQLPLTYSSFEFRHLIQEVIEQMQYSTKSHRIVLQQEIGPLIISADKQRIEQVLINLISNAIKYSPEADQVNVKVVLNDNSVRVMVQDFGLGISQDQWEHIFSRFYRVEELASHISGLGIGLYICKEIVNRHQGELWVESTPGKGSVFFFEIPVN